MEGKMKWIDAMFPCSAQELREMLADAKLVQFHAGEAYGVMRVALPNQERMTEDEAISFFKKLVHRAIQIKEATE